MKKKISIVIPVFNEEENLREFYTRLTKVMSECIYDYDIIFVDDKFDNFKECTNAGIFTYLMTAKHNEYYNVGHRRIHNLENLI